MRLPFVAIMEEALAEQRVYGMDPGEVQLEQVIKDSRIGGYSSPSERRGHSSHFVVRSHECRRYIKVVH